MSSQPQRDQRVALVTGAARGIGRSIAIRLSAQGFLVALNDLPCNETALEGVVESIRTSQRDEHSAATTCLADISVEGEVERMIDEVVGYYGRLDVMVANAGILHRNLIVETTAAEWDESMAVNARGTFFCYKYAARQMIRQYEEAQQQGQVLAGLRIIGAASVAAKRAGTSLGAYSASKFAIRGLTQAAALELGQYGITVNAYAPGGIDTEMLGQIASGTAAEMGNDPEDYFQETGRPWGVLGNETTDVSNLVSFLASEESKFITGQSVRLQGCKF
ncbi:NAD-binding protein [Roridomyces roridus]|uniref:NAD-binding protein n=1 Tax=Roridomyces roridus TaxID=1738132 RepID=A0AAD7BHS3_9AGAR|nr:NAD-binding protein [Roridomyces roridus]